MSAFYNLKNHLLSECENQGGVSSVRNSAVLHYLLGFIFKLTSPMAFLKKRHSSGNTVSIITLTSNITIIKYTSYYLLRLISCLTYIHKYYLI